MRIPRRALALGAVGCLGALVLTACDDTNTTTRPGSELVLTGAQLPSLLDAPPSKIVAFRHTLVGSAPVWTQIPVQVDQRKVVPFGTYPSSNATAGVDGTVYGAGTGGPTALQYADPNTFVGADTDPNLDADDEVVFMVADGGGKARTDDHSSPAGVIANTGVAVQVDDPRASGERGWVYLFLSNTLDPSAGKDYVDYDFNLTSGAYKSTYKRADGPNPETSTVVTPSYQMSFTDRWIESAWQVRAPGATGVDILDGHKNQFIVTTCARSNVTFTDAEGAFVANVDGPVRAIRSYIGANSGPRTERTHKMYRDHEEVVTDLRVHAIPEIMDFIDYSSAAIGMTYRSSTLPGGAAIDGQGDAVPTALPAWESVSGPQGLVLTRNVFTSSEPTLGPATQEFYRDQTSPTEAQCWGDGSFLGASGTDIKATIPNTDPGTTPFATLQGVRTTWFGSPAADPSTIPATADDWAADVSTPLIPTITRYQP